MPSIVPRYHVFVDCTYDHPAALDSEQLLRQCRVNRGRTGGPGGQHRNKVETAIHLVHEPTGIEASAGERRSQIDNRRVAVFRLRVKLAVEHRISLPKFVRPGVLWQSRCKGGRIAVNPTHDDFPSMLAEAMDFIHDCRHDVKQAAERLSCSTTQLVRLLKAEPAALAKVNAGRTQRGLGTLH